MRSWLQGYPAIRKGVWCWPMATSPQQRRPNLPPMISFILDAFVVKETRMIGGRGWAGQLATTLTETPVGVGARWPVLRALYRKETHCEFCDCELPDWKNVLTPQCGANAPAVMNVNFDGRTYSFEVKPGPDGYRQFTEAIRRAFSLPDDSELNITFTCDEPSTTGWEEPPSPGMIQLMSNTPLGEILAIVKKTCRLAFFNSRKTPACIRLDKAYERIRAASDCLMVHNLVSSQLVLSSSISACWLQRKPFVQNVVYWNLPGANDCYGNELRAELDRCVHCAVVAPPLVHQGSLLTLQGAGAYDAAVHCASVSAARRILSQRGDTPTHAAGAPLRPFDQLLPYTPRGVSHCFHSHTLTAPALSCRELCASLQCSAMRRDL